MNGHKHFLRGAKRGLGTVPDLLVGDSVSNEWVEKIARRRDGLRDMIQMRTGKAPSAGTPPAGDVEQFQGEDWLYSEVSSHMESKVGDRND